MYELYWILITPFVITAIFLVGAIIGSKWPIPFFEKGHRFFGTVNEDAQKVIVSIMKQNGIKPWKTFETGITKQVIMNDKQTVIGCFSEDIGDLPKHVISIPVKDPWNSICLAMDEFAKADFKASYYQPLGNDMPFYLIKSEAFLEGGGIAFRKHIFKMPKPKWIKNPTEV